MKKLFTLVLITFLFSALFSTSFCKRRIEALAIGELSLAYRLISISAGLSIEGILDSTTISSYIKNVDSILSDGKKSLKMYATPETEISKKLNQSFDKLHSCTKLLILYTKLKDKHTVKKLKICMNEAESNINFISDKFNSTYKKEGKK